MLVLAVHPQPPAKYLTHPLICVCSVICQQMFPVLLLTGHGQALGMQVAEVRPVLLLLSHSFVSDSM